MLATQPVINWTEFVKAAKLVLGYDPSNIEATRPLSDFAKFLAILGKFKDQDKSDSLENLRAADSILNHLQFGFLVACTQSCLFELMQSSTLSVTTSAEAEKGTLALVSGTLKQWRDVTIELDENASSDVRLLVDKVLVYFERLGLYELWSNYRKKPLQDSTFLLERK